MRENNKLDLIRRIQSEQKEWSERNFPNNEAVQGILGVTEESGELAHAYLKTLQGIRGSKQSHLAAIKDALGDIFIYSCEIANKFDFDFQEVVEETWDEVKLRDWKKFPKNGLTE